MPLKVSQHRAEINIETKIKTAARLVFYRKGYSGSRTRDIAEEAGVNLALLNYYFRSKKNLFDVIMLETLVGFLQKMTLVVNDETNSLEDKVNLCTQGLIDFFTEEPEVPLFIMSEIRNDPDVFFDKLPTKNILQSVLIKQYQHAVQHRSLETINPLHFILNLSSLITYPFIANSLLKKLGRLSNKQFDKLMQERRKLIPIWVKAMLNPW
ncbi:MAG TPA: TetR family transcriptional regulator [Flavitalea sp.]|nr:TetR family transcriptional regulator [Flavitalea sp.]